ncbi:MAG: DUF1501 domain-containing protein [Planctomycetales bacterium]|nr:DUF1501 domain-containing protein [Planctomycetales bacterium]
MASSQPDLQRRRLLQSVSAGVLGHGLSHLLARDAEAQSTLPRGRARNVLVIYEEGGISQMDSWDPKPHAPVDHRSPFPPTATNVPGIHYSSLLPQVARHADKLAVVRSMTTTRVAGHIEGCLEFFKGYRYDSSTFGISGMDYRTHRFPDIGAVATELLGTDCAELPGYILCPGANLPNLISNAGFLSAGRRAWKLGTKSLGENLADPAWRVRSLEPQPGLNAQRLDRRRELLGGLDLATSHEEADAIRRYHGHAFDLLTSPTVRGALSLENEPARVLERYGTDHRGRCYLLGRKLIEAGVRFVTVTVIQPPELVGRPGYGQSGGVLLNWDHHEGIYTNGPCGGPQADKNSERYGLPHGIMMPSLDRSLSALLEDLDERGLLDETLVCFITEMGRTPRMNKWQGRDHWARAMSIAFAGAGVPGGQVIGATNRDAGDVVTGAYTPYDYAETIYAKLGIPTQRRLRMPDSRQVAFSEGGRRIEELF